jgi:hypothetical protein
MTKFSLHHPGPESSTPLRYFAYVAGALLVLLVAAGVGTAAGIVFGGLPEWLTRGSGNANAPANMSVFTHTATTANSPGDYTTYISDPVIDGDPNAVVLVVPSTDRGNARGASYDHNIGVWYEGVNEKKWAIFNQDRAAIPAGTTFKVIIPPASETLVHYAKPNNTVGNRTYLDNPLTIGEPDALLTVTQDWNPGGGRGVYNDHPIDVLYDADIRKWAIYNRDGAPLPDGAAFNIAVSGVPNP